MKLKIAILITCYNRVEKTKECLNHCFNSLALVDNFDQDIFLLDDNSPDNTGEIIRNMYPSINVLYGDGKNFWSGGTRKLWELASTKKDYDYYVWLNDDSILYKNSFSVIYNDLITKNSSIIIGTLISNNKNLQEITYGGRNKNLKLIEPSGEPQECSLINGNFVFIPREVFKKVGFLSKIFTHNYADVDYGLRAIKKKFKIFIASEVIGICNNNELEEWRRPNTSFFSRLKSIYKSKNFIANEVIYFQLVHFGLFKLVKHFIGIFIIILSPKIYYKLSKVNFKNK
jgi:GT2 family glycosyltransferase